MSDTVALENAAAHARAARERMAATTRELQARLAPAVIADEVRDTLRGGVRELSETVGEAARRRPGAAAGIAALAAAIVLRRPIGRVVRRIFRRRRETVPPPRR